MFSAGGIAAALLLAPAAQAQIWTGGDGNWTDPAQWAPSVPAPADDIAIPDGTATIDGTAVTVHDITLYGNASIAGITVVNGGSLIGNYMLLPDLGGFARLAVSGAGSSVQLSRIGNRGNGESRIQVTQGGTLSVSAGIISLDPQPAISVLVEDAGSVLDFGTVLQMGGPGGGGGSVVVDDGGRLVGDKIELYGNSGLEIGTGTSFALGAIEGHGTSTVEAFNSDTVTLAANLGEADAGRLGVTMNGTGTLRLTGDSSYSGGTSIARGTLAALGAGKDSIGDQSNVVISAGATLSLTSGVPGGVAGAEDDDETIGSLNGAGTVVLGDRQLTVGDNSQSSEYAGIISGTGSIRKTGTTTLRLDAGNLYSGGTFIDGGVVELGADQAIGTGLLALDGGTLSIGSFQQTVGTLSGSAGSQITLGTGSVLVADSSAASEYAGSVAGSGTLVKKGAGALTLSGQLSGAMSLGLDAGALILAGANSFSGDARIGGTSVLTVGSDTALGSGRLVVDEGTPEVQALGDRVLTNAMVIDRADASLVVSGSDSLRLDGTMQASGSGTLGNLIKRGSGTLVLTGLNTINGLSLEEGTLTVGRVGALGNGPVALADGTTLRLDTYGTYDTFTRAVTLGAGQVQFDVTSDPTAFRWSSADLSGPISGSGGILLTGGGTLYLAGTNSFTGDVIVRQGRLEVDGGNAIADSVAVTLESGGELSMYGEETIGSLEGNGFLNLYLYGLTLGTNNRSTTFSGELGGSAAVRKQGTGTLTLSGSANQNYTGRIEIDDGEVRVTGTLGSNSVNLNSSTARLSGTGTIVGAVNSFDRGTLVGVAGQTLHMGSLALGDFGKLDLTLGAPGNAALFQVDGNVTIAGQINVTDAGGFGAGVYRLIDYGGTLTRRTVTFGTIPAGATAADLQLQTSVAGQVNLVSRYGLDLLFWDGGDTALYNNGVVDGGAGTWRATGTTWTDADGVANGAMRPMPGFAVFQGAAGTVTTDAGAGALSVTGMQFAADGYRIAGAGIGLAGSGARTVVRVGDGSAAGAGYSATIAAALSGTSDLVKTDRGTLILTGANRYRNTIVEGGTLIGSVASLRGNIANAGTLVFDQATDASFGGTIGGANGLDGAMIKRGAGTLTLGGASSLNWSIRAGTLIAGAAPFSGNAAVGSGASLVLTPTSDMRYAGVLSGSGDIAKTGAAALTLSGDSSAFAGAVSVAQGRLDVTGRLGGTLAVAAGATLGGTGALGAVTIADGATLAGAGGSTLRFTALDLASDARVTAAFGSPDAAALFAVSGDLTLDGTIDVSNAGSFAAGVYRLFDYGGTLTDRGLDVGATPAGVAASDLSVQTSVIGQVNLVNPNGMMLTFWDGDASANRNNGRVDGGAGIWRADGTSWTDAAGLSNGRYQPIPSLAVFAGTGGTVTIDNKAGALSVTGLQFAADGYRLEGEALGLVGADGRTAVRVGDGSAAGAGFTATIAAPLSGGGDLVKTDLGTLILTGTNSYTGNTRVEAGTLVGNTRSLRGNIAAAGTVVFDQADDSGFAGNIDGLDDTRGAAVKRGAGILTLAGTTSLDWRVEAGGLVTRTQAFTGNVDLADGSALTFDQAAAGSYAGRIGGTGTLRVTGGGAIDLSGDSHAFAGSLSVLGGSVSVSGALGGTTVIGAGGVLRGNGTVGSTTIASGGVLAPGNSIGTLTIAGDLTFAPGAVYQVEVDPAGTASDRVVVQGHATLAGSVAHIGMAGGYRPSATYTILTADGGITGSFGDVTSDFAFLSPTLGYTASAVTLTLRRNDIDFAAVAATRNQRAVAGAAGTLGSGNAVYDALLVLDAPGARAAFDQLSGELHASLAAQLSQDSRLVREAALGRMREAAGEPGVYAWAQGLGGWGHIGGDGNAARIERSAGGALFGFEAVTPQAVRLSGFGGYQRGDVRGGRAGSAKLDSYHLGLGVDAQIGAAALRAGYAFSWHDIAAHRRVAFTGFADDLRADYGASTAQIFGEAAYSVPMGAAVALAPFAGIAHVAVEPQAGQEKGGPAALRFAGRSFSTTYTSLGIEAALRPADGRYSIRTRLGWQHALGDVVPTATARLAGAGFDVAGVPLDRDALAAEAAVSTQLDTAWSVDLSYSAALADRTQDHAFRGRVTFRF
jgi:outer membrane autotransporter protein